MPHRWTGFPVAVLLRQEWFVELHAPLGNVDLVALDLEQRLYRIGAAVRGQAHHLPALVPVRENVDRDPAVERSEARHEVELIAEKSANRFEPDLFQRFNSRAFEPVIALRLACERIDVLGELARLGDVRTLVPTSVHNH